MWRAALVVSGVIGSYFELVAEASANLPFRPVSSRRRDLVAVATLHVMCLSRENGGPAGYF